MHERRPKEDSWAWENRVKENDEIVQARGEVLDSRWLIITEAVRRAILSSAEARRIAIGYTAKPLSEALPQDALGQFAEVDPRTSRLVRAMRETLGSVLELASIPDELLIPDLRHAPPMQRKQAAIDSLGRVFGQQYYETTVKQIRRRVESIPGITEAERDLVARRYRYARDVKLLGLMAELQEQPVGSAEARDGVITHELKSGTKLVMKSEVFETSPTLLDPQKWEKRRQLKDRVYVVTVDGKDYIMKERKTPRHTDVKKHGHKDGLTSQHEFEVAKEFGDLGTITQGDVELRWEKPLGYVEFPDGYQFCLFES